MINNFTLKDLLSVALKASEAASKIIADFTHDSSELIEWLKPDRSCVTSADMASNAVLEKILAETGIVIVSEENNILPQEGEPYWCVDPLDGTHIFLESLEANSNRSYFVNIALMDRHHRPIVAVISDPVKQDVLFTAKGMQTRYAAGFDDLRNGDQWDFKKAQILSVKVPNKPESTNGHIPDLKVAFNMRGNPEDLFYSIMRQLLSSKINLPEKPDDMTAFMDVKKILTGGMDVAIRSNEFFRSGYPHDNAPWWLLLENAGGKMVFMDKKDDPARTLVFSLDQPFRHGRRMPSFIATHADFAERFFNLA